MDKEEKNKNQIQLLLIEDDKVDQMAFKRAIKEQELDIECSIAATIKEGLELVASKKFDIVFTDYSLSDGTGLDVLKSIKDIPTILITGAGDEEIAVNAMKLGAYDYVIKDTERNYLKICPLIINNALKEKESEHRIKILSHAVMSANDGIYITDMDDIIIFVNRAFCRIYGYVVENIIGQHSDTIWSNPSENRFLSYINSRTMGGDWKGEFYHKRRDGSEFPVSLSRSVIKDDNEKGLAIVGISHDITERKQTEETIRKLAYYDYLTGLPNRILFNDRFQMSLAYSQRSQNNLAVMILDLDYFKKVNDTFGHNIGDKLLQEVSSRLTALIRKCDTMARMGGDEFIFLIQSQSKAEGKLIGKTAERFLEVLAKPFLLDGNEVNISGSIGIAIYPKDGQDSFGLLKNADIALYKVKRSGRNNYEYFSTKDE